MAAEPHVSVVMPVRDGRAYIAEAIESVLDQTHRVLELIVVDDGSTDGSAEVAERFGPDVRVLTQEAAGDASARNRGVSEATGEYLSFLDCDDLWAPGKTEAQFAALGADPELNMVFGHELRFRSPELDPDGPHFIGEGERRPALNSGTMLVSRSDFETVGPFEIWRLGTFLDWLARARDLGFRETILPGVMLHRRLHPASMTVRNRNHFTDYARVLKASLDRRRSAG